MKRPKSIIIAILIMIALMYAPMVTIVRSQTTYSSLYKVYWGTDQPVEVTPGDIATLTVIFRYEQGSTVNSIAANLFLPEGFSAIGGGNNVLIYRAGPVSPGSFFNLGFPIHIASTVALSSCVANLELQYYFSKSNIVIETMSVSFEVTGKPNIDVRVDSNIQEGYQDLDIVVFNKGDATASNLKISKIYSNVASVDALVDKVLGNLGAGVETIIPTHIYIPQKTTILTLTIEMSCIGPRNVLYQFSRVLYLSVKPYMMKPVLTVDVTPTELTIGKSGRLYLGLENIGSHNLTDIRLEISSNIMQNILGDTTKYIDKLEPGEEGKVHIEMYVPPTTTAATASLTVSMTYYDVEFRTTQTEDWKMNLLLVKPYMMKPVLTVDVTPTELTIGKSGRLYLGLENIGSHNLTDIRLEISSNIMQNILGDTTKYIDKLEPGEEGKVHIEMYVPPTTTAATASLTVSMTYYDVEFRTTQTEDWKMNLLLRGFIEISHTDTAIIPSEPRFGSPFSVTLTITNVGTSTAYAAYASPIIKGIPLKTFGPKSVYIGNIETNLPTSFTINLQLENATDRRMTLPIALTYMDNLRSLHNVTFNIPLSVSSQTVTPPQQPSSPEGRVRIVEIGAGIAIVVIIVVSYLLFRRRRH